MKVDTTLLYWSEFSNIQKLTANFQIACDYPLPYMKYLTKILAIYIIIWHISSQFFRSRDFSQFIDSRYGQCYQYPKNRKITPEVRFTGPKWGLKLVLNLDIDQYTFTSDAGERFFLTDCLHEWIFFFPLFLFWVFPFETELIGNHFSVQNFLPFR